MTEQQARATIGVAAVAIASALAALIWGQAAAAVVQAAAICWLLWDRVTLLERVDDIAEQTDLLRGPIAPYEPEDDWAPAELEQPTLEPATEELTIADELAADAQAHVARAAAVDDWQARMDADLAAFRARLAAMSGDTQ